jgi:hypothetical protein
LQPESKTDTSEFKEVGRAGPNDGVSKYGHATRTNREADSQRKTSKYEASDRAYVKDEPNDDQEHFKGVGHNAFTEYDNGPNSGSDRKVEAKAAPKALILDEDEIEQGAKAVAQDKRPGAKSEGSEVKEEQEEQEEREEQAEQEAVSACETAVAVTEAALLALEEAVSTSSIAPCIAVATFITNAAWSFAEVAAAGAMTVAAQAAAGFATDSAVSSIEDSVATAATAVATALAAWVTKSAWSFTTARAAAATSVAATAMATAVLEAAEVATEVAAAAAALTAAIAMALQVEAQATAWVLDADTAAEAAVAPAAAAAAAAAVASLATYMSGAAFRKTKAAVERKAMAMLLQRKREQACASIDRYMRHVLV